MNLVCVVGYAIAAGGLSSKLGLNEAQIGLAGGVYFFAYSISQFFLGILLIRVPMRLLMVASAWIAASGAWVMAFADSFPQLLLARCLFGIGFGSAFVGVVEVVSMVYSRRFPLMLNISQSCANGVGALTGVFAFLPWISNPSRLFGLSTVVLLSLSLLMLLLLSPQPQGPASPRQMVPSWVDIGRSLVLCTRSPRFWVGTLYFVGLFSCFLALEDLWNIRFQIDLFDATSGRAASMNSMLVSGLTLGGVISGLWATRSGLTTPSRVFSALALLTMVLLFSVSLSISLAFLAMFVLGFGLGAAPLGLSFVRQELPEKAVAVASPLLLTFVFVGGGLLMSLVGEDLSEVSRLTFLNYQQSMSFFIVPVAIAAVLSLLIRSPAREISSGE
nr:MFS transporter [Synechococcus sp. UW179A]